MSDNVFTTKSPGEDKLDSFLDENKPGGKTEEKVETTEEKVETTEEKVETVEEKVETTEEKVETTEEKVEDQVPDFDLEGFNKRFKTEIDSVDNLQSSLDSFHDKFKHQIVFI